MLSQSSTTRVWLSLAFVAGCSHATVAHEPRDANASRGSPQEARSADNRAPAPPAIQRPPGATTMTPLFRPISYFKDVPPFAFPGLDKLRTGAPASGTWPTTHGASSHSGRSAEPLVDDRFRVEWEVPLAGASRPKALLVGANRIVVSGADRHGLWAMDGRSVGFIPRGLGGAWLDVVGERLLVDADPAVSVYTLDGREESTMMLAAPGSGVTSEILAGPGSVVLLTVDAPPHGSHSSVVETTRIVDYGRTKRGTLYGVEPLAGITREEDAKVLIAAGPAGPVLATREGMEWRDWQLRPTHQVEVSGHPRALVVDDDNKAYLLLELEGVPHLQVFAPGAGALFDLALEDAGADSSLRLAASGQIYVITPRSVAAISPQGKQQWRLMRGGATTLSANGLLLLAGPTLDALTPDGRSVVLWQPPESLVTPPVLAGGRIYVASEERLYKLRPE